nr:hypothetical protein [Tanacetum cinerariifolium]
IDFSLAVLVFKQGDNPIDAINKMMSFLSTVVTSRFPTTNNQLRNSFNPRQQATIHDGREEPGKVLNEEELEFLVDHRVTKGPVTQMVITHNAAYQADDLDAYDSDCDDFSIAKVVFMANLSSYGSNVLSKITPDALTEGEWGFEHTQAVFIKEIIPFVKTLKDIFNVFDKDLLNETNIALKLKKQFLIENDRLLDQIITQDIVNIVVNSSLDINTSVNVNSSAAVNDSVNYVAMCNKCLELKDELIKQHNMVEKYKYNRHSKSFSKPEQRCISLELAMQLNKGIFQKNNTSVNQTEPSFDQLLELNNLKAELQAKDITIKKLKANIKRLNKTSTTNNVKKDIDEIETLNIELEH